MRLMPYGGDLSTSILTRRVRMPVMSYDEKTRVVNPMTLEVEWKKISGGM